MIYGEITIRKEKEKKKDVSEKNVMREKIIASSSIIILPIRLYDAVDTSSKIQR